MSPHPNDPTGADGADRPETPESLAALYARGLATRREVLGARYVDQAIAGADDFSRPLQQMVTTWAWGDVWNRPGLDRRTRSLLNLAMLAVLNRPHELKLHLQGALNNGVTREEIREVLLHAGVYGGMPAAVDAFRQAREVFAAIDGSTGAPAPGQNPRQPD